MSEVKIIKPFIKVLTKDAYETVKESIFKDVKEVDWAKIRNYTLLGIGFSFTAYLMYRNRLKIYSFIEYIRFSKEERINRRMNEWLRSKKDVEDHRRFSDALILEMSIAGLSKDYAFHLGNFIESYKQYFGPEITIFDICKCVINSSGDYSHHNWLFIARLCMIADLSNFETRIKHPILFSAMDVIQKLLKDLPNETSEDNFKLYFACYV